MLTRASDVSVARAEGHAAAGAPLRPHHITRQLVGTLHIGTLPTAESASRNDTLPPSWKK